MPPFGALFSQSFQSSEGDRWHSDDQRSHREICFPMCCKDHRRSVQGVAVRGEEECSREDCCHTSAEGRGEHSIRRHLGNTP